MDGPLDISCCMISIKPSLVASIKGVDPCFPLGYSTKWSWLLSSAPLASRIVTMGLCPSFAAKLSGYVILSKSFLEFEKKTTFQTGSKMLDLDWLPFEILKN